MGVQNSPSQWLRITKTKPLSHCLVGSPRPWKLSVLMSFHDQLPLKVVVVASSHHAARNDHLPLNPNRPPSCRPLYTRNSSSRLKHLIQTACRRSRPPKANRPFHNIGIRKM